MENIRPPLFIESVFPAVDFRSRKIPLVVDLQYASRVDGAHAPGRLGEHHVSCSSPERCRVSFCPGIRTHFVRRIHLAVAVQLCKWKNLSNAVGNPAVCAFFGAVRGRRAHARV